jgi:hypothetical protein
LFNYPEFSTKQQAGRPFAGFFMEAIRLIAQRLFDEGLFPATRNTAYSTKRC